MDSNIQRGWMQYLRRLRCWYRRWDCNAVGLNHVIMYTQLLMKIVNKHGSKQILRIQISQQIFK